MIRTVCNLLFNLQGWKCVNNVPDDIRSFLMIGVPHTSNMDIIPGMGLAERINRNAKFVIKSEWTKPPVGFFMKRAGAIGLDREKLSEKNHASNVEAMAALFTQHKDLVLMIAPEGTRKANPRWKTGFYYIAQKAKVPIVLGYADYEKREVGLGKVIWPTDFDKDMREIMDFYRNIKGHTPSNFLLDERYSGT